MRQSLLAILDLGPCYGYQLRAEFERRTGGSWPLNVGQIYQTLERLERDGLVAKSGSDREGRAYYEITDAGRAASAQWLHSPVPRQAASRDELAIKLAVAATLPGVDFPALLEAQRAVTVASLHALHALRAERDGERGKSESGRGAFDVAGGEDAADGLAALLLLDARIAQLDAELAWLDQAERRVARATAAGLAVALPLRTEVPKRGRPAHGE